MQWHYDLMSFLIDLFSKYVFSVCYIHILDSRLDTGNSVENKIDMVPVSMACIEYK